MNESADRTESIFAAAVALASDQERLAYLEQACAGDTVLRARIDALLRAHDRAGHLLDRPAGDATGAYEPAATVGTVIAGRYKLLEAIGEGGMGTVWVAEQTAPVRRKVALKLIKPGMDSGNVLARFEAERQALAMMDHPNIAKVLDGGLTETGRPFFAMEYVKGVPITEYCDAARLDIVERLNLFVQVCHAVQHAHQKGIIHRDLKPSNILVAPYDGKPIPKVIDFGLAKAMHQSLTERTLHTAHETVLGTPLYMSPEQAQLNNLDVDTRSDIYSLGVLLYELLTGTTPLEKQRFKEAAWDEIRRIIREEEPPLPSARLSSTETLPSLAACRHSEPLNLTRQIRGELDWIVMKALEKDRCRRYETANGFAMDVLRHLAGEPVLAVPPTAVYRLRKFVRRNKGSVIAASLVLFALIAGIVGTTWGFIQANEAAAAEQRARKDADDQKSKAIQAKLDADAKRVEAQTQQTRAEAGEKLAGDRLVQVEAEKKKVDEEKQIAEAVKDFLQNKLLRQADVMNQANALLRAGGLAAEVKENPTIRELLDRAAKELAPDKIDTNFPKQPLVQAAILETVGMTYVGVGHHERAIDLLQRALSLRRQHLGPDHPDLLTSMTNLGAAYHGAGKLDLALPLAEETLKQRKVKFGSQHSSTLSSMHNLATAYRAAGKLDLAVPLLEETLKLRNARLGADHLSTLASMNDLAVAYQEAGKLDLALPLLEETLKLTKAKLGPDHPQTLYCMNSAIMTYRAAGNLDLAIKFAEETLKLLKAKHGPDHPYTLMTMNTLGAAYQEFGKLDLALPILKESLKLMKAKLGADHPETLISVNNLADAYLDAGKCDLALPLLEETLELMTAKLGTDHPYTLTCKNSLAMAYQTAGKLDLALPLFEETLKVRKAKFGPEHLNTLFSMNNLAGAYRAAGKLDLAQSLGEDSLKLMKAKFGPDHLITLLGMETLAGTYQAAGKVDLALPLLEQTLKHRKARFGPENRSTLSSMKSLAGAYLVAGKLDLAQPLFEDLLKLLKTRLGPDHPDTIETNRIVEFVRNMIAASERYQRALAAMGPRHIDTLLARRDLAQFNMASNRLDDAEQILAEVIGEMKTRPSDDPILVFTIRLLQNCQTSRASKMPNSWLTFHSKSLLGGALLVQKKYAEAESLLLAGYKGMKEREKTIPAEGKIRLLEAVERLVQHYEAMGKKDDAANWRKELDVIKAARKKAEKLP